MSEELSKSTGSVETLVAVAAPAVAPAVAPPVKRSDEEIKKVKRARKTISLEEKMSLIEESESVGYSQIAAARRHGMRPQTLNQILKNKDIIRKSAMKKCNLKKSSYQSHGKEKELEEDLFKWYLNLRAQSLQENGTRNSPSEKGSSLGPLLRSQAEKMAQEMNLNTKLKFSAGWLNGWTRRFGIQLNQLNEQDEHHFNSAQEWIQTVLPTIFQQYESYNIFNAHETPLFYRPIRQNIHLMPTEEESKGGGGGAKVVKERLTLLVTANMMGTEKPKLLVVGKSARPRGFPKELSKLPVKWETSKRGRMIASIWTSYLKNWDMKLRLEQRYIIILADNAPYHPQVPNLTNIRVEFIPPNLSPLIQPMDAGIIKVLKGYYSSELRRQILARIETGNDNDKKISILDSLYMIERAWNQVQPKTIENCFKKALRLEEDYGDIDIFAEVPVPNNLSKDEFVAGVNEEIEAEEYYIDDEEEPEEEDVQEKISPQECLLALSQIRSFGQYNGFSPQNLLHVQEMESKCLDLISKMKKHQQPKVVPVYTHQQYPNAQTFF